MEKIQDPPIFFIFGRPRSGTTLLRTLFDAHPNVKIPPEYPIFLNLCQRFGHVKTWDEQAIRAFIEHIQQKNIYTFWTFEGLNIDKALFLKKLLSEKEPLTLATLMKKVNLEAASVFPKKEIRWIGDKNPVYTIFMKRFMTIFPDSKYIFLVRDYRDNFVSMKKFEFEAPNALIQGYRWKYVTRMFLKFRSADPKRFFLVRYEDLVEKKEETFADLCRFLEIPFDPGVFDFRLKKEAMYKVYSSEVIEKYQKSLLEPITTGKIGKWKTELTRDQIRKLDFMAGKVAGLLGYERRYAGRSPGLLLGGCMASIYGYGLYQIMILGSYLPYRLNWWFSQRLPLLAKTYRSWFAKK